MIPIRDANPSGTKPWVTISLISLNIAVFLYQATLPSVELHHFTLSYGLIPGLVSGRINPASIPGGDTGMLVRFFSSLFLHGGLMHLLANMWYLWIFGDNVEDRLGHGRFFLLYLAWGFAASIAQIVANVSSPVPIIGASGAIAGVLGAYLICFPIARVTVYLPPFFFFRLPASLVLSIWFVMQLFQGTLDAGIGGTGVAWWAHIGGFLAGALAARYVPCHRKSKQADYTVWFDQTTGRKVIDIDPDR